MARHKKTLKTVLRGGSDASIGFEELCGLLVHLGFEKRVRGSHHIFCMNDVEELINLQKSGKEAKPYQVKQVRAVITRYGLGGDDD